MERQTVPQAAKREFRTREDTIKNLKELFVARGHTLQPTGSRSSSTRTTARSSSTPLAGAVLSGNWVLFKRIYDMYESLPNQRWSREEVGRKSSNSINHLSTSQIQHVSFCFFYVQCEIPPQICNFAVARTESAKTPCFTVQKML